MDIVDRLDRVQAYVRTADFPISVKAVTIPNDDGTFDIYVNKNITPDVQYSALVHELKHIEKNHFYQDWQNIRTIESEAGIAMEWAM